MYHHLNTAKVEVDSLTRPNRSRPRPSHIGTQVMLHRQEATVTMFAGHIVIGIFADDDSPLLGLRNLVMPLRLHTCSIIPSVKTLCIIKYETCLKQMIKIAQYLPITILWPDTHYYFSANQRFLLQLKLPSQVTTINFTRCPQLLSLLIAIDAGLQTSHMPTCATSSSWET